MYRGHSSGAQAHSKAETPAVRPALLRRRRFGDVLSYPDMKGRWEPVPSVRGRVLYYLTSREARPMPEKYHLLWSEFKIRDPWKLRKGVTPQKAASRDRASSKTNDAPPGAADHKAAGENRGICPSSTSFAIKRRKPCRGPALRKSALERRNVNLI